MAPGLAGSQDAQVSTGGVCLPARRDPSRGRRICDVAHRCIHRSLRASGDVSSARRRFGRADRVVALLAAECVDHTPGLGGTFPQAAITDQRCLLCGRVGAFRSVYVPHGHRSGSHEPLDAGASGLGSVSYRTYHDVKGDDLSRLGDQVAGQRKRVADRLASIGQVVAVLSGKGGVGKSYVSSLLAVAASAKGWAVGVLDADLNSPTVGRLLNSGALEMTDVALLPAIGDLGVKVVSSDLILDEDAPLRWKSASSSEEFVWRGTLEVGMLREFLADVEWGALDLLIVDLPPGAEAAKDLMTLVPSVAVGFAVTIPTEESRRSVARAIRVARDAGMPLGGIIENMSSYLGEDSDEPRPLFEGVAGEALAEEFDIPLLGRLPLRPERAPRDVVDDCEDLLQQIFRVLA